MLRGAFLADSFSDIALSDGATILTLPLIKTGLFKVDTIAILIFAFEEFRQANFNSAV